MHATLMNIYRKFENYMTDVVVEINTNRKRKLCYVDEMNYVNVNVTDLDVR